MDDTKLAELRALHRTLGDALWAYDSAQSMVHKATAGYRASETLGDAPWNLGTYLGRRVAAELRLEEIAGGLGL